MANAIQRTLVHSFKYLPKSWLLKMSGGEPISMGGRTLHPMMQVVWAQATAAGAPDYDSVQPSDIRNGMAEGAALLEIKPRQMSRVETRMIPGLGGDIPVRLYWPRDLPDDAAIVLWFHQGGFVVGSAELSEPFCTLLADEAKVIVANVDYRLAPEHKYPAQAEDAMAAYDWALANAADLGSDPARIVVAGDSAGGNLASMIPYQAKAQGKQLPIYQILVYAWLTTKQAMPSYETYATAYPLSKDLMDWFGSLCFTDDGQRNDPRLSALDQEDCSFIPPTMIMTAGFDPLTDEGKAYADKLAAAGVDVKFKCFDGLTHSFTMMGGAVPEAHAANLEIARTLRDALNTR